MDDKLFVLTLVMTGVVSIAIIGLVALLIVSVLDRRKNKPLFCEEQAEYASVSMMLP